MRKDILLFIFVLIISCKASYPWYDFMVFQNRNNFPIGSGVEHIILRSNSNYMYCTEHDGWEERYLNIGKWEQRMDTLFLYPGYEIELLNPDKYLKKIKVMQPGDTVTDLTDYMGYDNFARIFLVRDTYIQEITDYSCCFLGSNGEMIGGKEPAPAIEYRRKYRIKLTSRKGRFNLLEYLKGSESNKK